MGNNIKGAINVLNPPFEPLAQVTLSQNVCFVMFKESVVQGPYITPGKEDIIFPITQETSRMVFNPANKDRQATCRG